MTMQRLAHLHIMIINARKRRLPSKLAGLGALCAAVGAGIWTGQRDGLVVGAMIVIFTLSFFTFQILIRLTFLLLSAFTLPSYKRSMNRDRWNTRHEGNFNYKSFQSDTGKTAHEYSDSQQYEHSDNGSSYSESECQSDGGMTVEEARTLLGVGEIFSMDELKRIWKATLKSCHPDQHFNSAKSEIYEERAKKVNEAFSLLKKMAVDS